MKHVGTLILSSLFAVAYPSSLMGQAPPENNEFLPAKDCADAMRIAYDPKLKQPLALSEYIVKPVKLRENKSSYEVELKYEPVDTLIYYFEWPNMSNADRAAVRRHLPALRAHEAGHQEIAKEFADAHKFADHKSEQTFPHEAGEKFPTAAIEAWYYPLNTELQKKQLLYDKITNYGKTQNVRSEQFENLTGERFENLVFNCWPIRVIGQSYSIRVRAERTDETIDAIESEDAEYSAEDISGALSTISDIAAGLLKAGDRRTKPVIRKSSYSIGSGWINVEGEGAPISVGEPMSTKHTVKIPGGGFASGNLDVTFKSGEKGEFIVNGTVGLKTATGGGTGKSTAKAELVITIGSPTAALVDVSNCGLFNKQLFAPGDNYVDAGNDCTFKMYPMADELGAVFYLLAEAEADNPAVPRNFSIRITEEKK